MTSGHVRPNLSDVATNGPLRNLCWRPYVLPALPIAVAQVVWTHFASPHQHSALAVALLVLGPAALALRRRYPLAVLGAVFADTLTYSLLGYAQGPVWLALIAAFFAASSQGHRWVAWASLVFGYVVFMWLVPLADQGPLPSLPVALGVAAWMAALGAVAELIALRRHERARRLAGGTKRTGAGRVRSASASPESSTTCWLITSR